MKSDDKNKSGKQKPTMKRRDNSKPGSTVVYRGIEIKKFFGCYLKSLCQSDIWRDILLVLMYYVLTCFLF